LISLKYGYLYTFKAAKPVWNLEDPVISSINGTHSNGKNNNNVKGLFFGFENHTIDIDNFPRNLSSFFPNLRAIALKVSKISSIDLEPFADLEIFMLAGSEMTSILGDLFKHNEKLEELHFEDNKCIVSSEAKTIEIIH
jgi:hypothetical protein